MPRLLVLSTCLECCPCIPFPLKLDKIHNFCIGPFAATVIENPLYCLFPMLEDPI